MKKCELILNDRREYFKNEWKKLEEEEIKLEEKREQILEFKAIIEANSNKPIKNTNNENEYIAAKFELEKLKLENANINMKLESMSLLLKKYTVQGDPESREINSNSSQRNNTLIEFLLTDKYSKIRETNGSIFDDSKDIFVSNKLKKIKINKDKEAGVSEYNAYSDSNFESSEELIKQSKIKLRLINSTKEIKGENQNDNESSQYEINSESDSSNSEYSKRYYKRDKIILDGKDNKQITDKINREKDSIHVTNILLEKYKQTFMDRKLKLKSLQLEIRYDTCISHESEKENAVNKQKLELEKENIVLETLNLKLETVMHLNNQRNNQLNLLESMIRSIDSKNNIEIKANEIDNDNNKDINLYVISKPNINPILGKIRKLNKRLNITMKNLITHFPLESEIQMRENNIIDSVLINEKWNKYIAKSSEMSHQARNELNLNDMYSNYYSGEKTWEKSTAYQRLTLESGRRALNQKWNNCFGSRTESEKKHKISKANIQNNSSNKFLKKSTSNSSGLLFQLTPSFRQLPESTKFRLNTHREWLKNFKANLNSNTNLSIVNT
jgi:hypothetical protein